MFHIFYLRFRIIFGSFLKMHFFTLVAITIIRFFGLKFFLYFKGFVCFYLLMLSIVIFNRIFF
jgi:hypothetical protein